MLCRNKIQVSIKSLLNYEPSVPCVEYTFTFSCSMCAFRAFRCPFPLTDVLLLSAFLPCMLYIPLHACFRAFICACASHYLLSYMLSKLFGALCALCFRCYFHCVSSLVYIFHVRDLLY